MFWEKLGLQPGGYFVVTLHRLAHTDDEQQLSPLLQTIAKEACGVPGGKGYPSAHVNSRKIAKKTQDEPLPTE